ncbi:MAG: NAD(P)H-hydrate dehydratase [Candidatus Nezhaarchaeota archaeon]|nr:NAD(P)H-hydrate dehydratase [Candidatus Nezhaarchaeota archaeon]MCX8141570.1 NAD(P)H-hydrate dehydratase [Candidatus Nezhaarchaeota archaeon]MDW8049837.1 NAD(P)H-hydrate dehydratase [Nitrososphaerota archaeon]
MIECDVRGELDEVTAEEMAIIDENAEYLGVSRLLLMENAGRSVAEVIERKLGIRGKKIVIVAGRGNKGGDGFTAARHIACRGGRPVVILVGKGEDIEGLEAKYNWEAIRRMDSTIRLIELGDYIDLNKFKAELDGADVVVDALIGTGLRGTLREPLLSIVKHINSCKAFKVSIDIPTGINPSTGEVHGEAVRADVTVTMHKPKKGLRGNERYTGEVVIANIGAPPEAEIIVGPGDVRFTVRRRPPESKKGDWGKVLVVGGGFQYSGAPALTALAALRGGCDLAVVIAPNSVSSVIRSFSPNLIVRDVDGYKITSRHVDEIVKVAEGFDCIAIGPGMGVDDEVFEAVRLIVERLKGVDKPMVIDADGLKALVGHLSVVEGAKAVLTPHVGEFKMLFKLDLRGSWIDKAHVVMSVAREHKVTLLVKAHPEDVISDGVRVKVNMTGNPAMTVGGTGDILTGLTASILSRKYPCLRAAAAAAFICGAAGSLAAEERGYHILATDLLDKIPEVMRRFEPWIAGTSKVLERRRD